MGITRKGGRYYPYRREVDPQTGESKAKYGFGGYKTLKEAKAVEVRLLHDVQRGLYVEPTKQTLGQYLDEWVAAKRTRLKLSAWDSHRSNSDAHIKPRIGDIPLPKLSPAHLNRFYADLLEDGRKDGGGGLSARTVRIVHATLHVALQDAVRWGRVARNVAQLADPPRQVRSEMHTWTAEQLRAFLDSVSEDRLAACYQLAATTGMRRGELLGLPWSDVDLMGGARLHVQQALVVVNYQLHFSAPKTARSRRSLALDPSTVTALRAHRARQLEERLAWEGAYQESGLVFTREDGAPLHPQSLSDAFERRVKAAGLPRIRLHDLRHTYATIALTAGVHPKVVSERLGHSNIGITLDTYSHVIPELAEEAANSVAALILGSGRANSSRHRG
ncbi:MAG: tyrosine-type recombinase/integrase [Actinomycetota bacterium]